MCGIAGIIAPGRSPEWLSTTASRMADAIRHRGPDAGGLWRDPDASIALSHRRLSILDLSPLGAQPMHSASERYVISFNGEVFNFGDLRAELEAVGARFRGGSDTEVMLAAFEAWGIERAVQRFIGMFAFALWDRLERTLHLVRDRLGIKPLYYRSDGPLFLFGSELKALTACDAWQPEVDRDALTAFARWNYVPSPWCIYRGVSKLQPGHWLSLRPGSAPDVRAYWDLRKVVAAGHRHPFEGSDADAEGALDTLLRDAVRRRMIADVPLGAFLSGGTDSSLVTALMQAQSSRPVRTFSIGFREREYDEAIHAKRVAARLGTDHTELYVGSEEALDVIPRLGSYYDEPFADSSQIPTFLVSQMTRRHVTVALSGDGGDELFAGYTRYHYAELVRRRFLALPGPLRRALASAIELTPGSAWRSLARVIPAARRPQRVGERALKLAAFLRQPDADSIYRRQHTHWVEPERIVRGGREPHGSPFDATLREDIPDFVQRMQFLDMVTYLPDDILTKVDRASMAVSLEARVPLLDHRVVEFSWRLPQAMKVRAGVSKWLLRKVLYRYVPPALIERPKMGFSIPTGRWLRGPLRDWAEALLTPTRLSEFFDEREVREAWNRYLGGDDSYQEPLWGVLMFQEWRSRNLSPRAAAPAAS